MKKKVEFPFVENQNEYKVVLKRRRYWWLLWFLLLLLPLFLLLHCEKEVHFKVINADDNKPIQSALVTFSYPSYELLGSVQEIKRKDTTNVDGKAIFTKIWYSLFARIFHSDAISVALAESHCFLSDSLKLRFFEIKDKEEIPIKLIVRRVPLDFLVVDKSDNQPIPEAKVVLKIFSYERRDTLTVDSTDAAGMFAKKLVPYCGRFSIVASRYGYENDTITANVCDVLDDLKKRTLRLKPIKKMVVVFVKHLNTKAPLPDATVTMTIAGKSQIFRVNTNGVGKGVYDDVFILSEMNLLAQKTFFNDTSKSSRVDKFVALSEEERTLYLRPKNVEIAFRDIELGSGTPIAGARNVIFVNGVKRDIPEISNADGIFTLTELKENDVISIVASKFNYEDNDFTIKDKKVSDLLSAPPSDRDIPLKRFPPPPPPPPPAPVPKDVEIILDKCWNAGRDHYKFYIDGKLIANYKSSAGDNEVGGSDGPHNQRDVYVRKLKPGKHIIELRVVREPGAGTCSCSKVRIPSISFLGSLSRSHNNEPRVHRFEIIIP